MANWISDTTQIENQYINMDMVSNFEFEPLRIRFFAGDKTITWCYENQEDFKTVLKFIESTIGSQQSFFKI